MTESQIRKKDVCPSAGGKKKGKGKSSGKKQEYQQQRGEKKRNNWQCYFSKKKKEKKGVGDFSLGGEKETMTVYRKGKGEEGNRFLKL